MERLFREQKWLGRYFNQFSIKSVRVDRLDKYTVAQGTYVEGPAEGAYLKTAKSYNSYSGDRGGGGYWLHILLVDEAGNLIAAVGENPKKMVFPLTRKWSRVQSFFRRQKDSLWNVLEKMDPEVRLHIAYIVQFTGSIHQSVLLIKAPKSCSIAELFIKIQEQNQKEFAQTLSFS